MRQRLPCNDAKVTFFLSQNGKEKNKFHLLFSFCFSNVKTVQTTLNQYNSIHFLFGSLSNEVVKKMLGIHLSFNSCKKLLTIIFLFLQI
jgi:hypothetical protein